MNDHNVELTVNKANEVIKIQHRPPYAVKGHVVAEVPLTNGLPRETNEANARVLAASYTMFAALEKVTHSLCLLQPFEAQDNALINDSNNALISEAINECDRAIEFAKGQGLAIRQTDREPYAD